jgi:diguanylate cyclase (GGDEF)-like protein/PAS domain S-box-containing protein
MQAIDAAPGGGPGGAPGGAEDVAGEYEALLQFVYLCPHGMAQFDARGTILMLNPAFACLAMPLLPPGGMLSNLVEAIEPFLPELRSLLRDPRPHGMICDGVRMHLGAPPAGQDPRVLSLTVVRMDAERHMAVLSDVTRQVAYERQLQESEAWFSAVVQGADEYAVLGIDSDGLVSEWNVSGERLFGHGAQTVLGRPASEVVGFGTADAAAFMDRLREAGRDGWHLDEGWRTRAGGARFWGTCMVSPVDVDAAGTFGARRYLMVVRDVTERGHSTRELRRALTADHLTGVLNRRCFLERAERETTRQPQREPPCCLAMVDVDHFKSVNDTHGHAAGDAVLRAIAETLRAGVRDADLVGRLGGEEFAVLMPATTPQDATALAETLRADVAALRLSHDGRALQVTVSIGLSAYGEPTLKRLLLDADAALYAAKRSGRNRVCLAATEQARKQG